MSVHEKYMEALGGVTAALDELNDMVRTLVEAGADGVNYGHVGDMKRLEAEILAITDRLAGRGEYATLWDSR